MTPTEDKVNKIAEIRVKEEINRGVQMIQYQVITLMTTNGQAPFITVFMYWMRYRKASFAMILPQ